MSNIDIIVALKKCFFDVSIINPKYTFYYKINLYFDYKYIMAYIFSYAENPNVSSKIWCN